MKTGYYWIKLNGQILPARWDGEKWNHENGHSHLDECEIIIALDFQCPTGCVCTQNPNGTWKVEC